jgi:resuscitation-promoting factor RpfB
MTTFFRVPLLFFAILLAMMLLAVDFEKRVYLEIDGHINEMHTSALTVGQLIQRSELLLYEGDSLEPGMGHWLKDGDTITLRRAMQVLVEADDRQRAFLTHERLPVRILEQARIELSPTDVLVVNGLSAAPDAPLSTAGPHSLQVIRSHQVDLQVGSRSYSFSTTAPTLGQALWEAGFPLHHADILDPPADTPLEGSIKANLHPSHEIIIEVPGRSIKVRSVEKKVGAILAGAGLALQGSDYSLPPLDAVVSNGERIRLVRVSEQISLDSTPLPFETQYQPTSDLDIDNMKVIQPGAYGLSTQRIRHRLEDGQEVSRQVEMEFTSLEPRPKIIGYGTRISPRTLDMSDGSLQYWRELKMYAVSYNPTSAGGTITASGLPLRKGLVAVDPNYIPLGTRLYVPGYGHALAADTGGGVRGRMIDLGYSDHDYVPWRSWITVYFLWPPPENIVWVIP